MLRSIKSPRHRRRDLASFRIFMRPAQRCSAAKTWARETARTRLDAVVSPCAFCSRLILDDFLGGSDAATATAVEAACAVSADGGAGRFPTSLW